MGEIVISLAMLVLAAVIAGVSYFKRHRPVICDSRLGLLAGETRELLRTNGYARVAIQNNRLLGSGLKPCLVCRYGHKIQKGSWCYECEKETISYYP